jgi:hypothetical protein
MIVWVFILVALIALTIFIATYALPSIYLRLRYTVDKTNDRCIKRVYEKHGQSMVFEPEEKWRNYIEQYVLAERKGKKELMCKVDKSLDYIEFDIVVFNAMNKVSKIIRAKDGVNGSGFTKPIELPEDTSYLSINIIRADNRLFEDHLTAKVSIGKKIKFLLINALMVITEVICFKICFANLFGGLFRDSMIINLEGLIFSGLVAGVLIILNTVITVIAVKIREIKFTVKVKKDA